MSYIDNYNLKMNIACFITQNKNINIDEYYRALNIFDYFKDELTIQDLKDMLQFINFAESLGFDKECTFRVGIEGCASGMWAKNNFEQEIYRTFLPENNYYSITNPNKDSIMYGFLVGECKSEDILIRRYTDLYKTVFFLKQIPKKPIKGEHSSLKNQYWECPECNASLTELNANNDYCPYCGQRLKWGDL